MEERYITLEFNKYAPEYIPIGNDNGDYELVMKSGERITRFGFIEQGSIGSLSPEYLKTLINGIKTDINSALKTKVTLIIQYL